MSIPVGKAQYHPPMRGYNADTMLRLARCDRVQPVVLEQFLTRCQRASHGRYEIATAGGVVERAFWVTVVLIPIGYLAAMLLGWGGVALIVAPLLTGGSWLVYMAVSDLRILRSVRRTREGKCAVCNYQIHAAPPPGAITAIVTCPECGEEVVAGRDTDGHGAAARAALRPTDLGSC